MAKTPPPISPLAPARFPDLPVINGVAIATAAAGVRYAGRTDLLLATLAPRTAAAGVFTTSKAPSAPVDWCRVNLEKARATEDGPVGRALVVNSGNANAFTGKAGAAAAKDTAAAAAKAVGCRQRDVFIASTGVIGAPLPAEKIVAALDDLAARAAPGGWEQAARAIMTTDTFPKGAGRVADIDGRTVNIVGVAKGSGMIAPDMATMLCFIFTDAPIPAEPLQAMLSIAVRDSFNAITVDSDASTSDTVLAFATGAVTLDRPVRRVGDPRLKGFRAALQELMVDLAQQVVRDGEGASKFVTVRVTGAENPLAARRIAFSIANSPLVKTAIAGEDPNWGRIVMAVGKSGEAADRDGLSIRLCGIEVAVDGAVAPGYREADGAAAMKRAEINIEVDVAVGDGESTVWTCDLTHGYVSINADYRS